MAQKTNDNIYKLINDLRLELKGDIEAVSTKVDNLNIVVSNNATKQAISTTKLGALITGITVVASGIVSVIVNAILGRH